MASIQFSEAWKEAEAGISVADLCRKHGMNDASFYKWWVKYGGMAKKLDAERKVAVVGTSGLSWPDGRQAIVTHIEVEQGKGKWLYRCMQYFSADMQQTGEQCYELRE